MESVKTHGADSHTLRANKLALVERLADDLAHEIKNPLHSMVINLEVLKRRVSRWSGADATDLMRYVGILSGELDRVSRRVDLLFRMVRLDRAGDPASLADTLDELMEVVDLERERLGVSIELQPPTGTARARIPRDSARQIVLNLLLMALDSAAPGGSVQISSAMDADEERLRLLVIPGSATDRATSPGVSGDRMMLTAVRALADPYGAQVQVGSPAGPEATTEIVIAIPSGPV